MIIDHWPFVVLSTTVSSPIWTQMAYPEKGSSNALSMFKTMNCTFKNAEMANSQVLISSTALRFQMLSKFSCSQKKMHNPADHIFPPQWLVKAFQILIAQLPHDPHLNSSAKGSFSSAAQPNSQPSPHQLSEESSNKQANTNCVSPLTNNNDKLSLLIKELF